MRLCVQKNITSICKAIIFFSLFVFLPFIAEAATLSISPSSGVFEVGDRATIKILVNSGTTPFNAVSGTVSFPTSIFSLDSVSKANSVLNFWVTEPTVSGGTVKFEGIALGGNGSSSGTVITLNLHAIKVGSGSASFKSGQILANDGQGTDITGNLVGASFTVKEARPKEVPPPVITPAPVVVTEVTQPAPTLKPPEIMLGTKYGAQAILGTSDYPKAQALITFVAEDGAKVFILGPSDVDGSFNLLIPNSLKRNNYSVTAVMIRPDKTNSEDSNTIMVKVGGIFSDIGWETQVLILLLILVIIYLILRIYLHWGKNRKIDESIKKEIHEAEEVVHKSFKALRDDVTDRARGIVSPVERSNIEELKKDMESTEKIITKEIKDIES